MGIYRSKIPQILYDRVKFSEMELAGFNYWMQESHVTTDCSQGKNKAMTKVENKGALAENMNLELLEVKEAGEYGKRTWYHPRHFQTFTDAVTEWFF